MTGLQPVPTATGKREHPALRIGFVLARNFTLSALSLFIDTLRLAADEGDRSRQIRCSWTVMSARGEPVRSSCGVSVARTSPFLDPSAFDYVVVVGGLLHAGQQADDATLAYLKAAAAAGRPLIGVCTGSFILSRAGLMKGRRTCVSWYHYSDFEAEFPDQTPDADQLFIIDGDRITCAGGGGVADLAAHLIKTHVGQAAAQKSLHVLQITGARSGSDAQPHAGSELAGDDRVNRAMLLMEQHVGEPLAIEAIASRLKLSTRQLERLFHETLSMTPALAYRQMRLRYARRLLETTRKSVTEIAIEAGFCDGAHFARQFRGQFGIAPRDVRATRRAGLIPPLAVDLPALVQ